MKLSVQVARWNVVTAYLLVIAQPLIFYRRVLFNPRMHIPYDLVGYHLPLASYIARCVRQGVFPFWDPYPYCGVPIHADITAQLFYPFTWISLLLGNVSGGHNLLYWLEWLVPLHMILAGLFTFWLLRSLGTAVPVAVFGASVYQMGGFFASQAQHLGAICSGAWLPLLLLCVWKLSQKITIRWICLFAWGVALTILSGFTATASVAFGAAGLFAAGLAISRRPNWKLLAACAAGLAAGNAMAAVQLIPTYQLSERSVASDRPQAQTTGGGLRVQSLASLVIPNYYHIYNPFNSRLYTLPINFTFLYVYCGLIPLALIVAAPFLGGARYPRLFFAFTLISAIWMLGDETALYRVIYTHLPRLLRGGLYAEMALLAFSMFAALTAAAALQRFAGRAPQWVFWSTALLTTADLIHFGANKPMNAQAGSYKVWHTEYQMPEWPGALPRIRALVETANPPLRVDYTRTDILSATTGAELLELPTADGDNPFALKRVLALRRLFTGGNWWERQLPVNRPTSPLLSMLNVGLIGQLRGAPEPPGLQHLPLEAEFAGVSWYRNPAVLPRFFLVPRLLRAANEQDALHDLASPDFKPAKEAVVEAPALPAQNLLSGGDVQVERYSPNRIELRVRAAGRAFLASSEVLYPGWSVTVNKKPAPLYMTNGAFRGLFLSRGTSEIVMTYWPEGFALWAAISMVFTLLALIGAVLGDTEIRSSTPTS